VEGPGVTVDNDDASCAQHHLHQQAPAGGDTELGETSTVGLGTSIYAPENDAAVFDSAPKLAEPGNKHVKVDAGGGGGSGGQNPAGMLGRMKKAALHGVTYDIHKVLYRLASAAAEASQQQSVQRLP
jgi:hypothetical protein